jgi:hypothetical protein
VDIFVPHQRPYETHQFGSWRRIPEGASDDSLIDGLPAWQI